MSDTRETQKPTRREVLEAALTVGTYAAPLILSASVPATLSAQVSAAPTSIPPTLAGVVTFANTGMPISGAFISVGVVDVVLAVTDANGAYSIANPPTGLQTVRTSADTYTSRTDSVAIAEFGTTVFSPSLNPGD